jgi:ubiquinone/menaquinone biosynthesis C-methylase UbiE
VYQVDSFNNKDPILGEPALQIASEFVQLNVIASDVAPDMVAKAVARIEGKQLSNIRAAVIDAQQMASIPDGSIDFVTCCYGYMFCPNLPSALSESRRALKAGGYLITTVGCGTPRWITSFLRLLSRSGRICP